jgi:hypothetical protein
MFRQCL